jgi:hypothetical protein
MRKQKTLFLLLIFLIISILGIGGPLLKAEEKKKEGPEPKIPEWLKRTNYSVYIENGQKPRIYFETVQPLYQSSDKVNTFFTHDRISIQEERGTYSAGLGYRRLLFDDNLLAGINTFFDYQDLHKHYRQGLGLEAITKMLEARSNFYFALSPKRLVEDTPGAYIYERAANGIDMELGGPVPYFPWLKIYGGSYIYDFKMSKDMVGWQLRGEIKPYKFMTINLMTRNDNKGTPEYILDGRMTFAFDDLNPKNILSAFKFPDKPYPNADLKKRTLDRVERNFNIVVEKWSQSKAGNVIVEIKRGS